MPTDLAPGALHLLLHYRREKKEKCTTSPCHERLAPAKGAGKRFRIARGQMASFLEVLAVTKLQKASVSGCSRVVASFEAVVNMLL
jgi:hypothetical protein